MLDELLASESRIMRAEIEKIRATLIHRGNKGSEAETILRMFLGKYLPRRLSIGQGEIIDRSLSRSRQADIVITNEHHPLTFREDRPGIFFIEGVSAVGEVKMVLTSEELRKSFEAARQYKKLSIKPPAGANAWASPADRDRHYRCPPFFLFAFESELSLSTVNEKIYDHTKDVYSPGESIDGIFVLDKGYLIDYGSGNESYKYTFHDKMQNASGWQFFETAEVLFNMLGWLSCVMPVYWGGLPVLAAYLVSQLSPVGQLANLSCSNQPAPPTPE